MKNNEDERSELFNLKDKRLRLSVFKQRNSIIWRRENRGTFTEIRTTKRKSTCCLKYSWEKQEKAFSESVVIKHWNGLLVKANLNVHPTMNLGKLLEVLSANCFVAT